jgi:hypothetical protein
MLANPPEHVIAFFISRTLRHMNAVDVTIRRLCDRFADIVDYNDMRNRASYHDQSKFQSPELLSYIWKTWEFRCRDRGTEYDGPEVVGWLDAVQHHYAHNDHHPEYWGDPRPMPMNALAEMVADWHAVSSEKGTNLFEWYELQNRWDFSDEQDHLIKQFIVML